MDHMDCSSCHIGLSPMHQPDWCTTQWSQPHWEGKKFHKLISTRYTCDVRPISGDFLFRLFERRSRVCQAVIKAKCGDILFPCFCLLNDSMFSSKMKEQLCPFVHVHGLHTEQTEEEQRSNPSVSPHCWRSEISTANPTSALLFRALVTFVRGWITSTSENVEQPWDNISPSQKVLFDSEQLPSDDCHNAVNNTSSIQQCGHGAAWHHCVGGSERLAPLTDPYLGCFISTSMEVGSRGDVGSSAVRTTCTTTLEKHPQSSLYLNVWFNFSPFASILALLQ